LAIIGPTRSRSFCFTTNPRGELDYADIPQLTLHRDAHQAWRVRTRSFRVPRSPRSRAA
jgi:hypothetical protein